MIKPCIYPQNITVPVGPKNNRPKLNPTMDRCRVAGLFISNALWAIYDCILYWLDSFKNSNLTYCFNLSMSTNRRFNLLFYLKQILNKLQLFSHFVNYMLKH